MSQPSPLLPPSIELAMFAQHVGDDFRIRVGEEFRTVRLLEAVGYESRKAGPSQQAHSFSLMFDDPVATVASHLAQGTYRFEHGELGSLDMFLVPVGPGKNSAGICYEVIFNTGLS